jgi:hypothetical protein
MAGSGSATGPFSSNFLVTNERYHVAAATDEIGLVLGG